MKINKIISKITVILLLIIFIIIQPIAFAENIGNEVLNEVNNEINNEVNNNIINEVSNEIATDEITTDGSIFIEDTIIENENLELDNKELVNDVVTLDDNNQEAVVGESSHNASSNYANVYYRTHAQNIGWQKVFSNGETAGTYGRGLRLEAIEITLDSNLSGNVIYQSYVENISCKNKIRW